MTFNRCYSCMKELPASGGVCTHCGFDNGRANGTQPSHVLSCGTVLNRRYVIGRSLGQGGFGITYIGYDLKLELTVCIKEYYPEGAAMRNSGQSLLVYWGTSENAQALQQGRDSFVREARKAVKLRDLGAVVKVWDVFYENETAYIIMDYIEGETLKNQLLRTQRLLSGEACLALLAPVMSDLVEVHKRGIIHRDISPDNLMLRPNGTLVLLDIGAAKDLSSGGGQSSFVVAKHGFSPPEQYTAGGMIGPWTDVYAMCATFYYCTSGKLVPIPMDRMMGKTIDLNSYSPAIAAVLERGLALKPEDRIQSMAELLDALQETNEKQEDSQADTYQEALRLMTQGAPDSLREAHRVFVLLGQYREAAQLAEICREHIKASEIKQAYLKQKLTERHIKNPALPVPVGISVNDSGIYVSTYVDKQLLEIYERKLHQGESVWSLLQTNGFEDIIVDTICSIQREYGLKECFIVLSVPDRFGLSERARINLLAKYAGISIKRIIPESSAIALYHGCFDNHESNDTYYLMIVVLDEHVKTGRYFEVGDNVIEAIRYFSLSEMEESEALLELSCDLKWINRVEIVSFLTVEKCEAFISSLKAAFPQVDFEQIPIRQVSMNTAASGAALLSAAVTREELLPDEVKYLLLIDTIRYPIAFSRTNDIEIIMEECCTIPAKKSQIFSVKGEEIVKILELRGDNNILLGSLVISAKEDSELEITVDIDAAFNLITTIKELLSTNYKDNIMLGSFVLW